MSAWMLAGNETPFAAVGFGDVHRDGTTMAVVCVRATYDLTGDGVLQIAPEQAIVFSDLYESDPQKTPLVRASDLGGFKAAADVTVLGTAHAPDGRKLRSWTVAVEVGSHRAALRIHGPRCWEPTFKRLKPTWTLGPSEPVASVPLDFRHASGGRVVGDPDGDCDPRNPIGPGLIHAGWTARGRPLRAPQIDSEAEPVIDPLARPEPQGFGPVPPWWLWREQHGGTRDEAWLQRRHPHPPEDFDYRSEQVAHPKLVLPRLVGDEAVRLIGLTPGGGSLAFALPGLVAVARHLWFDGRETTARLTLDGLHLDLRAAAPPWQVALTWRGWIASCPAYNGAVVSVAPLAAAVGLAVSAEHGLAEASS